MTNIKVLKETIKKWVHEYNMLDACLDLTQCKISELKTENEVLKQALDKEPLAQKALVTAYSGYKKQVLELYKVLGSYKQTLQEIKTIAKRLLNKNEFVYMNYRDVRQIIRLITKAESEGWDENIRNER